MTLCQNCRHWKTQPPDGQWLESLIQSGVCGRIFEGPYGSIDKAVTFNHHGDDSGLITAPDFGCVLGEAK
jgi:hypothetical protein